MLDFTSSLYLGLRHDSRSLRPWTQLTTGVPAALASPPGAEQVAERLARLQGCERATLGPSTLHLFWDLFGMLAREPVAIYVDAAAYPIAQWGATRAAVQGAVIKRLPHHDASALAQMVAQAPHLKPVVVADGVCTCCGTLAPAHAYVDAIHPYGGLLVLDDTQALGIMGCSHSMQDPYGLGGGGSLRWSGLEGANVVLVCSLAKALGAPLAALSGSRGMIERFEATSRTRVHCSPPSAADTHAAEHALVLNEHMGDELRRQLAERVRYFRGQLDALGIPVAGGLFPVQSLPSMPVAAASELHVRLRAARIRTVLQNGKDRGMARVAFVITARHRLDAIGWAVSVLARIHRSPMPAQAGHG